MLETSSADKGKRVHGGGSSFERNLSNKGVIWEMAVKIRLTRMGSKKKPFYRIIAADSEAPRDGRFLEILGYYDPMKEPCVIEIHKDKVTSWLDKGAMVSDSAKALLKKKGLLQSRFVQESAQ